jgi:hypothetical protein
VDIPGGPETSERVWASVEGEERKGRLDETGAEFPGFIRLIRASDETRFMSGNHRVPFSPRPVPHPASAVRRPSISLHTAVDSHSSMAYACKCLNIRIETRPAPSEQPPQLGSDPEFAPVFIGQDGIRVVSKHGRPPCRVSHPRFLAVASPGHSAYSIAGYSNWRHFAMHALHVTDMSRMPNPRLSRSSGRTPGHARAGGPPVANRGVGRAGDHEKLEWLD